MYAKITNEPVDMEPVHMEPIKDLPQGSLQGLLSNTRNLQEENAGLVLSIHNFLFGGQPMNVVEPEKPACAYDEIVICNKNEAKLSKALFALAEKLGLL